MTSTLTKQRDLEGTAQERSIVSGWYHGPLCLQIIRTRYGSYRVNLQVADFPDQNTPSEGSTGLTISGRELRHLRHQLNMAYRFIEADLGIRRNALKPRRGLFDGMRRRVATLIMRIRGDHDWM